MSGARYTVKVQSHGGLPAAIFETTDFAEASARAERENLSGRWAAVALEGRAPSGSVLHHRLAPPPPPAQENGALEQVWIVTTASPSSKLSDILFPANPRGLARVFGGGLDPESCTMFAHYSDAHMEALRRLANRERQARS